MSNRYVCLDVDCMLLENILNQLDITLSTLVSDIRGSDSRTLTDIYNIGSGIKSQTDKLTFDGSNYLYVRIGASDVSIGGSAQLQVQDSSGNWNNVGYASGDLNVPISIQADNVGLATESTLSGIKSQTDKLSFDTNNYLNIDIAADSVGLAKDSTLSSLNNKFPSSTALGDSLSNPTTTIIGSALLGWDGTYWRRVAVDSSSRIRSVVESLPSLPSGTNIIGGVFADHGYGTTINQQVGTTEVTGNAIDVTRRGRKVIYMNNTQDVSVTVTIEGSYDGSTWYTIRDNITLDSNTSKIGILDAGFGYIRAKAVASSSPSTGSVTIVVESIT